MQHAKCVRYTRKDMRSARSRENGSAAGAVAPLGILGGVGRERSELAFERDETQLLESVIHASTAGGCDTHRFRTYGLFRIALAL
jgi:hypothetical protein